MGHYALKKIDKRINIPVNRYGLKLHLSLYEMKYVHSETKDFYYEHRWDLDPCEQTKATGEKLLTLGFDRLDSATISKSLNVKDDKENFAFVLDTFKKKLFAEDELSAYNLLPHELKRIFEKEIIYYGNRIWDVNHDYDEHSGKGLKITFYDKLHFYPTAPMIDKEYLRGVYQLNDMKLGSIMGLQSSADEKFVPYEWQHLYYDCSMSVDEWLETRKLRKPLVQCEYCIDVDDNKT